MSGFFDLLKLIRSDAALSAIPIVVFTGKELTSDEDAQLHSIARSVVVKGVESPERLLDKPRCSCTGLSTICPPKSRRCCSASHSSDEDLVGKAVLLVDDDARNIFALSSALERRGMNVLTATTGSEAIALVNSTPDFGPGAHGYHDAGNGRISDYPT